MFRSLFFSGLCHKCMSLSATCDLYLLCLTATGPPHSLLAHSFSIGFPSLKTFCSLCFRVGNNSHFPGAEWVTDACVESLPWLFHWIWVLRARFVCQLLFPFSVRKLLLGHLGNAAGYTRGKQGHLGNAAGYTRGKQESLHNDYLPGFWQSGTHCLLSISATYKSRMTKAENASHITVTTGWAEQ